MTSNVDLMEKQHALEQEAAGLGEASFWKSIEKARQRSNESDTGYGQFVLAHAVIPVEKAIVEFLAEAESGKPGRRAKAFKYLKQIEPRIAAFIITKTVIDGLAQQHTLQRVALRVAQGLEDEVRFRKFDSEVKGLFRKVRDEVTKRTGNEQWQRKVLVHSMNKAQVHWEPWLETEKLHLGQKSIELLITSTGLVRVETKQVGKNKSRTALVATEDTEKLISERNARSAILTPHYLPTVVPPKDWTNPFDGGYHFRPFTVPLVKTPNRNYLEELRNRVTEMPEVYEAINSLQRTAWKINRDVLRVALALHDSGVAVAGLPSRDNEPLPAKPVDIQTNEEARTAWKRVASKVHDRNAKAVSKRMQTLKTLWVAEKMAEDSAIYFPMQMDFRGRVYCLPMYLNPQGADLAKSLLTFANGKPIADERAAGWLMVHGANTFGQDKCPLEERIEWVEKHTDRILSVAENPTDDIWWTDADSPFQFLAFCFEYAAFRREGYGYVSHLPVAMDGSCNGLQHFSAMLRDEVGGRAVNLIPSDKPEDIYTRVAEVVIAKLKVTTGENTMLAAQWLTYGITRKVTKRPVMVMPYGGTMFSCRGYIMDYVVEATAEGKACPWEEDKLFGACTFLAKLVWESIGEVVIAARRAMDWLQKSAGIAAGLGLPILWRTPDGFPVVQAYQETKSRKVETILGKRIQLRLLETLPTLDKKRQANGISPNFVHSMDACAMRQYIVLARDNGIESFATVHDSFGTLAADTEVSQACLRHAFVDLYSNTDVLADLRASLVEMLQDESKLPPLPPSGSLELERVREAQYFFA